MPKSMKMIDKKKKGQNVNPKKRKTDAKKSEKVETRKKTSKKVEEENLWALGKSRYVGVNEFMGSVSVDMRCYYFKDGDIHPSRAGISLNMDQWEEFMKCKDKIDKTAEARSNKKVA